MAEEIVTRFTADLTDLQAKVKQATSILEGYTETADEAGNAVAAQGKKVGDLEAKTKTLVATEQALATASTQATQAIVEQGTKGAPAVDRLTKSERAATIEAKNLANAQGQVAKNTEGAGQKLSIFQRISQGISGTFTRIKTSAIEFGRGAKAGFQEAIAGVRNLGVNIGSATTSFGSFGSTALGLLGPIGIGVGALATGLLAVARNTDAGQVAIDGLGRTSGLVFDRITGKVKDLFAILTGDSAIGQIFQKLTAGAELFIKTLSPIAPLLAILKVTGISDAFSEDVEEGQKLAALYDDLEDKQNAVNEKTAANEIIIRRNLSALRDITKPVEERLKLADQITAAEKENLALKKLQLFAELAILNARAKAQLDRKGEIDDELKAEISALRAGLSTLEAESESLLERVSARRNAILDGDQAQNDARRAKEKAAADKAFNEEKQRIEKLAALREQAAQTQEELERDALRRQTLGEDGAPTLSTQILDVDFQVEDQINAAKENAKQQEALAKGNAADLERIAQELADTIALIREKGNAEVLALQLKFYRTEEEKAKAAKDAVAQALLSDDEAQRAAINAKYDKLLSDFELYVTDEDLIAQKRIALNKRRQEELDGIVEDSEKRRVELFKDVGDELGDAVGESVARLVEGNGQAITAIQQNYQQQIADLEGFIGTEKELQLERLKITQERDAALAAEKKKGNKEFLAILLDGLEKALKVYIADVTIANTAKGAEKGGVAGAIAGAAIGAAIAAILSGIFNALKGSISGAYEGERNIGANGESPIWSGKDGYLRRVHKGEDIVRAQMARKHRGPLDAIHDDKFDDWLQRELAFTMPDFEVMPAINTYLEGDTGQRMTAAISLPRGWDRNSVEATNRVASEQKRTNKLLLAIAEDKKRERSSRTWGLN